MSLALLIAAGLIAVVLLFTYLAFGTTNAILAGIAIRALAAIAMVAVVSAVVLAIVEVVA